jgi:NAD(P)-dependent dehydrogenase (short-subunit alcohol dehydrogenase family)
MTGSPQTHLIIGASRGIGLGFVRQLLSSSPNNFIIATYRSAAVPDTLSNFSEGDKSRLSLLRCDINDEESIKSLASEVSKLIARDEWEGGAGLETVVVNAGVLEWPNGVLGS